MSINMQNSIFLLIVDGLGLVEFNKAEKNCQITFLHEETHKLQINAYEPTSLKQGDKSFVLNDVEIQYNILPLLPLAQKDYFGQDELFKVSLKLIGEGNPHISGYKKFMEKGFKRNDDNSVSKYDYQWMVNIEELHGSKLKKRTNSGLKKIAKSILKIKNGEFFTFEKDNQDYNRIHISKETMPERFGKIGAKIGVIIKSNFLTFELRAENEKYNRKFENKDTSPIIFEITNRMVADDPIESSNFLTGLDGDMKHYYELFEVKEEAKIEVEKIQNSSEVGATRYCHPIEYSGG